jgi:hypothetical protein
MTASSSPNKIRYIGQQLAQNIDVQLMDPNKGGFTIYQVMYELQIKVSI